MSKQKKTSKDLTPKEKEIELLQELKDLDGYFNEIFGPDIFQMQENIKRDFPITIATTYESIKDELDKAETRVGGLTSRLVVKTEEAKILRNEAKERETFIQTLLDESVKSDVYVIKKFFSVERIIKTKLRLDVPLNKEERNLLLSII